MIIAKIIHIRTQKTKKVYICLSTVIERFNVRLKFNIVNNFTSK